MSVVLCVNLIDRRRSRRNTAGAGLPLVRYTWIGGIPCVRVWIGGILCVRVWIGGILGVRVAMGGIPGERAFMDGIFCVCYTWYQGSMDDIFGVKDVRVVCFA